MYEVYVGFENSNPDLSETVKVRFPFLPRIGETIYLNDKSVRTLAEKVCKNILTCKTHLRFLKGYNKEAFLCFDKATMVKKIDWLQDDTGGMICVLLIGQENYRHDKPDDINWEAVQANTIKYYSIPQ